MSRTIAESTGARRRKAWSLVWILGWFVLCAPANDDPVSDEDIMGGLVIDDTISNIGYEFYRYFGERLREGEPLEVTLVVHERPSARWGSLIWVELDGDTLYQRFLQPNTSQLQPIAYSAADSIHEAIARQSLEKLFEDNFDLEGDEL